MQAATFEEVRPDDYLARFAASDLGQAYKALAVAELSIRPGDVVLDLGCGPGADLPAFAAAAGPSGRVIGVDNDPAALNEAKDPRNAFLQKTGGSGDAGDRPPAGRAAIEVIEADIRALGLPAASVDRVHTDRVLQHVPEPEAALVEARRVLRGGGLAVLAEPDWDTLIVDYPDLTTARAYTRFITEHVVRNPCVGRQLPRLAAQAGFGVGKVIPITAVFRDAQAADQLLGLHRVTSRAVAAGYLGADEASRWLEYLATQPFFASATIFITVAVAVAPGSAG